MTKQLPVSGQSRGSILFAPEGWRFIIPTAALMLVAWFFGWAYVSTPLFILLVFMLNFFRDHEREIQQGDNLFICPADGKVIRAVQMEAGHQRVDIFMKGVQA